MIIIRPLQLSVALLLAVMPTAANACTLCSCTASTSSLSFGSYDPAAAAPRDATALVSVDCSGVVALFGLIEIRAGAGTSGNQLQRTLVRSGTALKYNLYADSARTQVLGDGTGSTTTLTASLNGLLLFSTSVPVFGRVPTDQWVPSGTYVDTVVITVQY
jgi:spore coat protein U-like protein